MPSSVALTFAKWALDAATRLIKADVRLHRAEVLSEDMAVIFAVNHFTRVETVLLPYILHKHTGREVWALAAAELFQGRVGQFLQSVGTISTQAPDRDQVIVRSLLEGVHPWAIFPEGAMIKDKKVIDHRGEFEVYSQGGRRPPHKGAAVLALRAEFYRQKLHCLHGRNNPEILAAALGRFQLESVEGVLGKRTVIVPVNITYFPMRAHENVFLRAAQRLSEDLSKRAIEELSVEGTVLSEATDIDITLGDPIDIREYLDAPEYAELMACGEHDLDALETDPTSLFNDAARKLMLRYMKAIYQLTTVNYDHIFASVLRYQPPGRFTEQTFRNRCYLCAREVVNMPDLRRHQLLETTYRHLAYQDVNIKFNDFMALCLREGVVIPEDHAYRKYPRAEHPFDFQTIRAHQLTDVIANEIEPLKKVTSAIRRISVTPRLFVLRRVRNIFCREDQERFEEDYARFYDPALSKGPGVGRPFLLAPWKVRGGVVLAHGYMAAPLEVRPIAEHLYRHGFAVYGVRLAGHGTSPEDLAQAPWEAWYEALNRGYAALQSLTDDIFAGGFSTGGCLALIAAARKQDRLRGVFSICAPLRLQNYSVRLAPSIITMNSLLKWIGRAGWEYVDNYPENKHINYNRNPLTGVRELLHVMNTAEALLPQIRIPALVIQGSKDTIVSPESAHTIFEGLGSDNKELIYFERNRHGIINGPGAHDIYERVDQFLFRTLNTAPATTAISQAPPESLPAPEAPAPVK
jgi:esterase/lipase/1-acyl-sn-glycerol-3-phosphate acyltransferase